MLSKTNHEKIFVEELKYVSAKKEVEKFQPSPNNWPSVRVISICCIIFIETVINEKLLSL